MKKQLVKVVLAAAFCLPLATAHAQEEGGLEFTVGGDLVSSYVWRGAYQSGFSVQPSLGLSYKGFSLGAWGSTDIIGFKEVDFSLGYSIAGFDIVVTDYWWSGEGAYNYFKKYDHDFDGDVVSTSDHLFEVGLAYTLPIEKFPLKLAWNTFFAGNDYKVDDEGKAKRAFSSYVEASFPFTIQSVAFEAALGIRPFESPAYEQANPPDNYGTDFAVTNISLKASKDIKITDSFTLPVFTQVIFNPNSEDVFLVFGISF
ncbi:hypothetical protein FACS1894156_6090 [Bacteroidia bacterium]|nr:hypothetical protein FACS1894156_6090 [Bacteroidia bacterium]